MAMSPDLCEELEKLLNRLRSEALAAQQRGMNKFITDMSSLRVRYPGPGTDLHGQLKMDLCLPLLKAIQVELWISLALMEDVMKFLDRCGTA